MAPIIDTAESRLIAAQWQKNLDKWTRTQRVNEAPSRASSQTLTAGTTTLTYFQIPFPLNSSITLKYTFDRIGTRSSDGWPLFITLHGGGSSPKEENDRAWADMSVYYKGAVKNGIHVALRGVNDEWNLHFTDEGYWLVERLIENLIMFENVNSNQVYVLGFSAGGDGVYQLGARLSQRFAAANMSAGHHNWVSLQNFMNLPLALQVGESDNAFSRSKVTVGNSQALTKFRTDYQSAINSASVPIYRNEVFVHPTPGPPSNIPISRPSDQTQGESWDLDVYYWRHNSWEWADLLKSPQRSSILSDTATWLRSYTDAAFAYDKFNWSIGLSIPSATTTANTNAVDWVTQFTRNPSPTHVIWDLTTRSASNATKSLSYPSNQNYWLAIDHPQITDYGNAITARIDQAKNTIIVTSAKNYLRIFLRTSMLDYTRPITVLMPGMKDPLTVMAVINAKVINDTMMRNDRNLVFSADIILTQQSAGGRWQATTSPQPTLTIQAKL